MTIPWYGWVLLAVFAGLIALVVFKIISVVLALIIFAVIVVALIALGVAVLKGLKPGDVP